MRKYLPAGPNALVWIVTVSLVAVLALLLALAGGIKSMPVSAAIVLYAVSGVVALALAVGWLARPIRYEVGDDTVCIVRSWPFAKITLPRSKIKGTRHVTLEAVLPASVVVVGVFGYAGRFRNPELGNFLLYATSTANTVLINADETYVISPANPKRFMHDLSGRK